jgi:dTDP-4-dehydrorhamnose 3,5-epimerase
MKVMHTGIPGILLIEPSVFKDHRGHFLELYHAQSYLETVIETKFVQDNLSHSWKGVLRGLHYQLGHPQGKLVCVVHGEIFDVAVDMRRGSPTFGKWTGGILSSTNCLQVYIPIGFAHGFCVVSETATVVYKCTDYYAPMEEHGIRWNDPDLGIKWPVPDPTLSAKDEVLPVLSEVPRDNLPEYEVRG